MFEKYGGLFTIDVAIIIYARALSSRSIEWRAFKSPTVNKTWIYITLSELLCWIFEVFIDNSPYSPLGKFHRISVGFLRRESSKGPENLLFSSFKVKIYCLIPGAEPFFLSTNRWALLSLHCHLPYRSCLPFAPLAVNHHTTQSRCLPESFVMKTCGTFQRSFLFSQLHSTRRGESIVRDRGDSLWD